MTQSGKPAPKRPAPRRGDNPRQVALTALQDVTRAGAYASLALNRRLRESDMPQRDKNLVSELVYGTLEKLLTLDYCIDRRLERTDIELLVRNILRLGAYQILYMRTPDHAAVDESVTLARRLVPWTSSVVRVNSWPSTRSAPPFSKQHSLISGPRVSRMAGMGRCSSLRTATRVRYTARWDSWVPWEKLKRAAFMPACIMARITSAELEAGPMVQMILVLRIEGHSLPSFILQ